jgi:hypothetical protein
MTMRKPALALLCLAPLPALMGFEQAPFDANAMAAARAGWVAANVACFKRDDYRAASGIIDCLTDADRGFAQAIRLRDVRLVNDYTARVKQVTLDVDASKLATADAVHRFRDAQSRFFKDMVSQYDNYEASMAQDMAAQTSTQPMMPGGMNGGMGGMDTMGGMGGM